MKTEGKKDTTATNPHVGHEEFKGYTLDELRYQRALLLLKKEFLKEKAVKQIHDVKERVPMLNGKSPLSTMSSKGILSRMAKGLNYADYIMIGFSVFNAGRKMISLFRKKK